MKQLAEVEEVRRRLSAPPDLKNQEAFLHIENRIGFGVPPVVRNVVDMANWLSAEHSWMFSHFEFLTLEELLSEYASWEKNVGYFGWYNYDENFELNKDSYINVYDGEIEDKSKSGITKNLSRYLPLGKIKIDYLVVDLGSNESNRLYNIELGYSAILYAPTMDEHLASLAAALKAGKVEMTDGEPCFSDNWHERRIDWSSR